MGLNATWSMAVGGMVGGGIFSVLGVVVEKGGSWAWLSFLVAGSIALATAFSYTQLADLFGEGGGAFTFLREIHREGVAGGLSWVLVFGYVLTISVYAFTFGHYLANALGAHDWVARLAGLAVVVTLTWVNLLGVGEASFVEIVTVWGKLLILLGLAGIGLWKWNPAQLSAGVEPKGLLAAIAAGATIFMAYEGFQLLTYDYEDIQNPRTTLRKGVLLAVVSVIAVYVLVTLGATSLVGAGTIVAKKEVALAVAGERALGQTGLILATVAAVFSTGSAINATLFATARLAQKIASDGEFPHFLAHENRTGIPDRAVILVGGLGALLAALGTLTELVEAASLIFLLTFAIVNAIAFSKIKKERWIPLLGAVGASASALYLGFSLAVSTPVDLAVLIGIVAIAILIRPLLMQRKGST